MIVILIIYCNREDTFNKRNSSTHSRCQICPLRSVISYEQYIIKITNTITKLPSFTLIHVCRILTLLLAMFLHNYTIHCDQVGKVARRLTMGFGRPGFDLGCRRGGDFSSLLRVQIGPRIHPVSYKLSTVCFIKINAQKTEGIVFKSQTLT